MRPVIAMTRTLKTDLAFILILALCILATDAYGGESSRTLSNEACRTQREEAFGQALVVLHAMKHDTSTRPLRHESNRIIRAEFYV
ncbi:MAG: hypothetical protein ABIK36_16285 [Pseudomonadota bacterium]